jgi:hypothetical protein
MYNPIAGSNRPNNAKDRPVFNEGLSQSTVVPVYKAGVVTDCSNFRGISFLLISYKIVSSILWQVNTVYGRNY